MKIEVMLYVNDVRLTLTEVKKYPIRDGIERAEAIDMGGSVSPPLAKIRPNVLGTCASGGWLYLVRDEVAGLVWVPPAPYFEKYNRELYRQGLDPEMHPSEVPTLIF